MALAAAAPLAAPVPLDTIPPPTTWTWDAASGYVPVPGS